MKSVLFIFLVVSACACSAQQPAKPLTITGENGIVRGDLHVSGSLLIGGDTTSIPANLKNKKAVASKGDSLYLFDKTLNKWLLLKPEVPADFVSWLDSTNVVTTNFTDAWGNKITELNQFYLPQFKNQRIRVFASQSLLPENDGLTGWYWKYDRATAILQVLPGMNKITAAGGISKMVVTAY